MSFESVVAVALTLPDVVLARRYDGSAVLKARGCFMARVAAHPSAEPETLIVRADPAHRVLLLDEAPDTYYITDYYRPYAVVLVRLSTLHHDALRELLAISWRLTMAKARGGSATAARVRDPLAPPACARRPRSRRSR